jgi:23S rRNA pseudouridine2605 synthase
VEERLQKILARTGIGSRRACEELIANGRVRVNGVVVTLGSKADPARDQITVDGSPLAQSAPLIYIALYKPHGVISSAISQDQRSSVLDLIPKGRGLYPVGRLDADSEGLILLTNDGDLANRLTHPRYGHEKEYKVLVAKHPDEKQLEDWRRGIVLKDGYRTAPAVVRIEVPYGKGAWVRVVLREGRKRQIRETGSLLGLPVTRIIRVRIGSLQLGQLKPGEWRYLTPEEVATLKGKPGKTSLKEKETGSKLMKIGVSSRPRRTPVRGKSR